MTGIPREGSLVKLEEEKKFLRHFGGETGYGAMILVELFGRNNKTYL